MLQPAPAPCVTAHFAEQRGIAELAPGRGARGFSGKAAVPMLLLAQLQVEAHLILQVTAEALAPK